MLRGRLGRGLVRRLAGCTRLRAAGGRHEHASVVDLSTNGSSPTLTPTPWPPLPPQKRGVTTFPPPPPTSDDLVVWSDEVWASPLAKTRHVYCNRSLNMSRIKAIGFDMDYTLAQYKPETFETLAHQQTVDKLIKYFGYPRTLYDLKFDWRYMCRGLVIDKQRGNILKVDRHKYVKLAYHGFRSLSREDRMATYNEADTRMEFDEPECAMIDTLFSLAEAHLFAQLVEWLDKDPASLPPGKSHFDLYRDVRGAVDLCHRDGSIKRAVAANPEQFIHDDPGLAPLLQMLRQSGKKLFVATNSLWDYSNVVMNWVLERKKGSERDESWLEYFDAVVVGCAKPRYFTERSNLFEVHIPTGMLLNTEGGSPMVPIGEEDLPTPILASTAPSHVDESKAAGKRARVFQGGFYLDLHKMLGIKGGSEVLYIGDHLYADVLRSKKTLGWRTMLVVPELGSELTVLKRCEGNMQELQLLRQHRDALEDQIQRLEWQLSFGAGSGSDSFNTDADESWDGEAASWSEMLGNLRQQRDTLRTRHRALLKAHHEQFHPVWGQLLKTGYQNSRYAHQMERFACLYTSHVSNLIFYSPFKSYRGKLDMLVHEELPGGTVEESAGEQ